MNQEQNNLNTNNFNSQGNNGIPNNQPLNNQNFNQGMEFNQQTINPQPQQVPTFQQPTPQPINSFESSNTSNHSFNSKSPKKINLGLIIGIIVAVVFVGVGIVVSIKLLLNGNQSCNTNNSNSQNNELNNNINDSRKINESKLDLYNDIAESNYLSVLLYDPLKERQKSGDKANYDKSIIVTYNLGENIKTNIINNGFKVVANSDDGVGGLKYYFGLTNGKYVLYQVTSTTSLNDGSSWLGFVTNQNNDLLAFNDDSRNNVSVRDKGYSHSSEIHGTNWYATNYGELGTNKISVQVAQTETQNIYVLSQLNNVINFDESFTNTVNNIIANNQLKNTLTIIENTDELDSDINVYGKKVNLKETVFYQDLISTIISNEYGLNLKNKDYFYRTDTMYIKYRAYTYDDYLTEITFEYPKEKYDYVDALTNMPDSSFEYLYNNIKYSYFVDVKDVYVYKNEEFVGKVIVTHRGKTPDDVFSELSYIFGTKNNRK